MGFRLGLMCPERNGRQKQDSSKKAERKDEVSRAWNSQASVRSSTMRDGFVAKAATLAASTNKHLTLGGEKFEKTGLFCGFDAITCS